MEWSAKYRPACFEEVRGQNQAVSVLSRMVLSGHPRAVVLSGPTGSGKTTLGLIYAQAVLCRLPTATGSPCGRCDSCERFEERVHPEFHRFDPSANGAEELRQLVAVQEFEPVFTARRVFFFDEAARLTPAKDILYPELENPRAAVFVFTLIDAEDLPMALATRAARVRLASTDAQVSTRQLERICIAEAVPFEPEALDLIASSARSYREAVADLQTVAEAGGVNVATVRSELLEPRYGWLSSYFVGLTDDDLQASLEALLRSGLSPHEQVDAILATANLLKLRYMGPPQVVGPAAPSLLDAGTCIMLAERLRSRADARQQPVEELWAAVVGGWANAPLRLSPEVVRALAIRLHETVQGRLARSPIEQGPRRAVIAATSSPTTPAPRTRPRRLGSLTDELPPTSHFIDFRAAQSIYEAATAALQFYWAPFSLRLRVEWSNDVPDEAAANDSGELLRRMSYALLRHAPGGRNAVHRIWVLERPPGMPLVTSVVAHIPPGLRPAANEWLARQSASGRWRATLHADVEDLKPINAQVKRHWDLVRELWRGVDPRERAGAGRRLIEILGVAANARPAGEVQARRFAASERIGPAARRSAASEGLPHVSAWAEGQWDKLFSGWERREFQFRSSEEAQRRSELEDFEARWGPVAAGGSVAVQSAKQNLSNFQSDRATSRPRHWP